MVPHWHTDRQSFGGPVLPAAFHSLRVSLCHSFYRRVAVRTEIAIRPYGNWAHFKAFITIPYQNGDPGALRVVQYILQDLLLRREKSMKDKDGNPIVPLPPKKTIQVKQISAEAHRLAD